MRRLAVAVVALAALVGCASGTLTPSPTLPEPTTTTIPGPTTTTLSAAAGANRFEACLRTNGLDIPAIPFDAQGRMRLELVLARVDFSTEENIAALDTCAHHLTAGPLALDGTPLINEAVNQMLVRFTECVRGRGVADFPDPVPGFNGVGSPFPTDRIPFHNPVLPEAVDVCRERMTG